MGISNCFCGGVPQYKEVSKCYGHGEFAVEGYIECPLCLIRTKSFIVNGLYGCPHSKDTVISYWNDFQNLVRR